MKREEAMSVLKELLDNCPSLDGHSLELTRPQPSTKEYQIIKPALDEETRNCIQVILNKHHLASQSGSMWKTRQSINKTEPDTFIIYKPKKSKVEH